MRTRMTTLVSLIVALLAAGEAPGRGQSPEPFVDIARVAPRIRLDLRYATENNFTKTRVYPVARCLLRRSVAGRLARVQRELEKEGLGLKLFDCYRPLSVQRRFWELVPDERYVANPKKGSRHNRGAAVDITLVDAAGAELDMGTGHDDFTPRAHRSFTDLPEKVRDNRARLLRAMAREGFVGMPTEWWHFDDREWTRYPISDEPLR